MMLALLKHLGDERRRGRKGSAYDAMLQLSEREDIICRLEMDEGIRGGMRVTRLEVKRGYVG